MLTERVNALPGSEVPIEKLTDFCESVATELMKDHEKRFAERTKAVREASNGLTSSAARFGAGVKSAWGSMEETASEYGARLAQTIQDTANQLAKTESSARFNDTESFHRQSVQALNKVIITVRRYVPKLHRGLKTEIAALNTALVKLESAVRALGAALDESPGTKIESLRRDAEALARRHSELLALRRERDEKVASLKEISTREEELLKEERDLTSQGEFLELKRYEETSHAKEDEIKQFFQPVVKPLLKLERVATTSRNAAIDVDTLHGLIDEPVQTVANRQSFSIAQLLDHLDEALGRGLLDVEERKRRKAEDTIQQVRSGVVATMRDEYLATQANVQETLRRLRASGLLEKRDKLHGHMAEVRSDKEALAAHHKDLDRRIDDLSREILKQKTALESKISKLSHISITILAG